MGRVVRDRPKPWHQLLDQLLSEREMSQEDLSYAARRPGGPKISSSLISKVKQGQRPLRPEFLEAIAGAFELAPELFVEYRLAQARQLLDESQVGLERAVENLGKFEDVVLVADEIRASIETLADREIAAAEVQQPPPGKARKSGAGTKNRKHRAA